MKGGIKILPSYFLKLIKALYTNLIVKMAFIVGVSRFCRKSFQIEQYQAFDRVFNFLLLANLKMIIYNTVFS